MLARKVRRFARADRAEQLDRGEHALAVLPGDVHAVDDLRADGNVYAVILAADLIEGDLPADVHIELDLNAGGEDGVDIAVQIVVRQAVARDAVTQHAAEPLVLFKHRDVIALELEIVRRRKARRSAADDGDRFAVERRARRRGDDARALDRVALQPADVDGIVHDLTAAVLFARMLADETADTGERVVLADEPHGVGIALLADESDVARHVHIRRAAGHARHGVERRGADPVFDVGHIIVPEGLQPVEHEARGLKPDGAVGAVVNGGGAAAHGAEIVRRSAAIEDLLQKRVQPVQPHAAGNAFSAALRKTQLHERGSQIDRTAPERRRSAAASERGIQLVHLFLRGGLLIYDQGSALPYI